MKKILTYILIITISCFVIAQAVTLKQENKNNEVVKRYLWDIPNVMYDLKTFKYNPITKTYSTDVIYQLIFAYDEYSRSPYDDNYIFFVILGTKYSSITKKLNVKYKGFVSADFIMSDEPEGIWYEDIKVYYDNNPKYLPQLKEYIKDFKAWVKNTDYKSSIWHEDMVMNKIFNAYKKGELYNIEGARPEIQDFLKKQY